MQRPRTSAEEFTYDTTCNRLLLMYVSAGVNKNFKHQSAKRQYRLKTLSPKKGLCNSIGS